MDPSAAPPMDHRAVSSTHDNQDLLPPSLPAVPSIGSPPIIPAFSFLGPYPTGWYPIPAMWRIISIEDSLVAFQKIATSSDVPHWERVLGVEVGESETGRGSTCPFLRPACMAPPSAASPSSRETRSLDQGCCFGESIPHGPTLHLGDPPSSSSFQEWLINRAARSSGPVPSISPISCFTFVWEEDSGHHMFACFLSAPKATKNDFPPPFRPPSSSAIGTNSTAQVWALRALEIV